MLENMLQSTIPFFFIPVLKKRDLSQKKLIGHFTVAVSASSSSNSLHVVFSSQEKFANAKVAP